jgi:hypothetical protein
MKKWFLLDRIELKRAEIAGGDEQLPSPIISNATYSIAALADDAPVAASEALQLAPTEIAIENTLLRVPA